MKTDGSLHLSDPVPEPRQFASKIDAWIVVIAMMPLAVAVTILAFNGGHPAALLLVLAPQAFLIWILAATSYTVTSESLVARCGPFRWIVLLASVRSLSATRNLLSSPALSLDRIAVEHTGGRLMVSPRNKAAFVAAVVSAAPDVRAHGLPGADGTGDFAESTFSMAGLMPALIVLTGSLLFLGWALFSTTRAPSVTVTSGGLEVDAYYSTSVRRADVVRISLEETLPRPQRVDGIETNGELRGFFDMEGLGRSRVFVSWQHPPYIVIRTTTQPLVISFKDPERTRALHRELTQTWQLGP